MSASFCVNVVKCTSCCDNVEDVLSPMFETLIINHGAATVDMSLTAECGDYVEADFGYGAGYLKSMKLLPCQTDEVEMKIMGHHREHL